MKKNCTRFTTLLLVLLFLFSVPSAVLAEIDETTAATHKIAEKILASENGELFDGYDYDDIAFVLDNNEIEAGRILKHFSEIAEPIISGEKEEESNTLRSRSSVTEHFSVEKDVDSEKEVIKYEDEFYEEPIEEEIEPEMMDDELKDSMPKGRSYADWKEYDPQNYSSTKSIFKLFIYKGSKIFIGSAFMLRDKYLGTVGHNLYNESKMGGWADRILCVPAWRVSEPYQPLGNRWVSNMECGGNWRIYTDENDDWGVITLSSSIGTGAMGRRNWKDDTNHDGESVRVAGYPANDGPMMLSWGYVTYTERRLVTTDHKIEYGMSGGPVTDRDGFIIGIHRDIKPRFIKFDNWIYNKMGSY